MKKYRLMIVLILTFGMLLLNVQTALANPPLPSSFNGTVKVNGVNVPAGTVVSAWIGGVQYRTTTVQYIAPDMKYLMSVPGYDPDTGLYPLGVENASIDFYIGSIKAAQTGTWHGGTNQQVNLTATSDVCYALTLSHGGQGSNPSASPTNSSGCTAGNYKAGETINLSGAVPTAGWQIGSWTGTTNDSSTAATNVVIMPVSDHTASVNYTGICYALTLSHTGQGSNPVASPTNSTGCTAGNYTVGATINLSGAVPTAGWQISSWTGTDNNTSTASTNVVTMPAGARTASVNYTGICYALTLSHTGQGSNPVASPTNSTGCTAGNYTVGTTINLSGAVPTAGWQISSWAGTDNNTSTAATNVVTMPAGIRTASVNYTGICYALTLSHTGQGSNPVASPTNSTGCTAGNYTVGATINLSGAAPTAGWQISSWAGTDNNTSTAATNVVTMPASARTASVNYTAICYALTLSHTGQGSNPVASPTNSTGCTAGNYTVGTTINLSGAVPTAGWQISSWAGTDNNTSTAATNVVTMPAGIRTASVNYTLICYALTLSHTGQGSNPVASPTNSTGCTASNYVPGATINLSGAVPTTGWQISSWTGTDNNTSTAATNVVTMPASARTASVNYTAVCYALTLSHTGQGSNPVASPTNSTGCTTGNYTVGATINLSGAVPTAGWQISSWTGTDNNTSTAATNVVTMPASTRTASVNYTAVCYALTLSHTGQGSDPVASPTNSTGCTTGNYTVGATINLSGAVPTAGWQISSWTGTDNNTSTAATNVVTMPASTRTASVNYTAVCYALTLSHTGQGSDPVASPTNSTGCTAGNYTVGTTINLSGAVPTAGWQISSWTGTDNNTSTTATNVVTMPAGARTASVNYTAICYALTLSHTGQGSDPVASPTNSTGCTAGNYTVGATINLSGAVPTAGWQISSWTGTDNNTSTAATNVVTMPASARTASANYTLICYALTLSETGQGSNPVASPTNSTGCAVGNYVPGAIINLSGAVPTAGWQISSWTGTDDDTSIAATNLVTMPASAHTAGVNYTAICYSLTTAVLPSGSGTVGVTASNCTGGMYTSGTLVTLTANAAYGYIFSSWSGDVSGTINPRTVTMSANRSVTANFTQILFPIYMPLIFR